MTEIADRFRRVADGFTRVIAADADQLTRVLAFYGRSVVYQ
jgi:hypothetical protein